VSAATQRLESALNTGGIVANPTERLFEQLNQREQYLRTVATYQQPQEELAWYRMVLWIQGVPYQLLDVDKELVELEAKRQLIRSCLFVQALSDTYINPDTREQLVSAMFNALAMPFAGYAD
jgi:hypothetical protein